LLLCLLLACLAPFAQGQATRTWVSGVGDDANPCSRTAPCLTFSGAYSKTAPAGIISVLDPGYFGSITITQAFTIEGGEGQAANIFTNGTAITVNNSEGSGPVVLRYLNLYGSGSAETGISVNAGNVVIENVQISEFQTGVELSPTTNSFGVLSGVSVTQCTTGIIQTTSHRNIIVNSIIAQNTVGIQVNAGTLAVLNSEIAQNSAEGILVTSGVVDVQNCQILANGVGLDFSHVAQVRSVQSDYLDNTSSMVCNTSLVAFSNNPNYYSVPLPAECT